MKTIKEHIKELKERTAHLSIWQQKDEIFENILRQYGEEVREECAELANGILDECQKTTYPNECRCHQDVPKSIRQNVIIE